ncbi:putative bifunctional diguanylate cyclase/phosphodiesterase [Rhizobium sp. G187]|uniref:putative bifunctional diguanylate cyclase/phosphodiesterase n=1 Tax=Rhizobium sp. G187 TaxID=3451352 RepID=UPI003EE4B7CB
MDSPRTAHIAKDFAAAMHLALIVTDRDGDIRFANPAFCEMFGYTIEQLLGRPITMIIPERMRGAHTAGMENVAGGAKPGLGGKSVEVFALKSDGTEFPIEITLSTWQDPYGFWAGATIRDISERRQRDTRLMRLASHDTLTGLQNRHEFMSCLAQKLTAGIPCTLVLMDLDGFKDVNDMHGHIVGDSLLQAVGVRLPYLLGEHALIGRLGGDEFAILFAGTGNVAEGRIEATKILTAFSKPFSLGGLELELSTSLGVAIAPRHGVEAEELLASADFALYRAKADGGRTFRMFDQSMRRESQVKRETRDELRLALRHGELELYYQPLVELASRRILGFEALIRWNHPERGLLQPSMFLPSLEQSSLSAEIGWWTIDEACRMAAKVNAKGANLKIAVNLFPTQFRAHNLRDRVIAAVQRHGIAPEWLELEVTEEVTLNNDEASLQTLNAMRDAGVGVAFDDFGTGYASLSSLQRYPLTTLKIDRAFISDIQTRPSDAAITRALVAMSHEMGLSTVAEGIETEAQEAVLLEMGCTQGQGYLYGRPMCERDAMALLAKAQTPTDDLRSTGT